MADDLNFFQRGVAWLASVSAVPVGMPNDGVDTPWYDSRYRAGTLADKTWEELSQQFDDALEAWRVNPYARRIVGLISAYVVGEKIEISSEREDLEEYIRAFFAHPKNQKLNINQADLCDELTRAGELFPVIFTNPQTGMCYVRCLPGSKIDAVKWLPGDYECETAYHEKAERYGWWGKQFNEPPRDPERKPYEKYDACSCDAGRTCQRCQDEMGHDGRWWAGRWSENVDVRGEDGIYPAVMLHYSVNRPVGAIRGEGDLVPMLPWLRRYTKWLDDRIRLNATVRSFLYVIYAKASVFKKTVERYRKPPAPGSVIVAEEGAERWETMTPDLRAADAKEDGRAIRWMIAAAGPGTSLLDFGEAEAANLATAKAMSEMRWRFLARRQAYFSWMLADIVVYCFNRSVRLGMLSGEEASIADIKVGAPDISPSDNESLSQAALRMAQAMKGLGEIGGGEAFRKKAAELVLKFAGEHMTEEDLNKCIAEIEGVPSPAPPSESDEVDLAGGAGGHRADPFRWDNYP